jgi:DNA-directed RNA polymerase subunit RPC12/RpoP
VRPPRTVEYICLACGVQGSTRREADGGEERAKGGFSLRCPKCGGSVLHLERKAAEDSFEAVATIGKA